MRLRKPKCPYCGEKLNYAKTWALKCRGEYICPKCGGLSNVRLDPMLYRVGVLALLAGAGFFAAGWLSQTFASILWSVSGTILPVAMFFLISVFFVRLRKPAPPRPQNAPNPAEKFMQPPGRVAPPR